LRDGVTRHRPAVPAENLQQLQQSFGASHVITVTQMC